MIKTSFKVIKIKYANNSNIYFEVFWYYNLYTIILRLGVQTEGKKILKPKIFVLIIQPIGLRIF